MFVMKALHGAPGTGVNLDPADQAAGAASEWMSAPEAAALLGVSRATLYAYVSRGRLASHRGPGAAARYRRADVQRLAALNAGAHRPRVAARTTLDWGLPVLESALTLIEGGRLYYRGQDALALADSATLEDVAALLWPGAPAAPLALLRERVRATTRARRASTRPAHAQLARAWRLDEAGAQVLRAALVLCADHELNASSFTVRCVASTGAALPACLVAGQAALSGPRHGGMTGGVEALWDRLAAARSPTREVRRWLDEARAAQRSRQRPAGVLPGFGHPLYPAGDPRAQALLARLPRDALRERIIATVHQATGLAPALDFALVAVRRALGLLPGAAFELFAIGRTVGWIAHALEQAATNALIRPRAIYVGPRPTPPAAAGRVVRPLRR